MKQLLPAGTRCYLPPEAAAKRRIEGILLATFAGWGYREIIVPTMEYMETIQPGTSDGLLKSAYKFFDPQGNILLLRPDLTTPIAHLAATRLSRQPRPLRYCYLGNVFRSTNERSGQLNEFYQAGVELMGIPDAPADTELIALAIECLQAVGLTEFQIGLGQVDFVAAVLAEPELAAGERERIREALGQRDLVGYREAIAQSALPDASRELLERLPSLHGGAEVLTQAAELTTNAAAQRALANLGQVYTALAAAELGRYLYLDLALVRNLDYYSGIVFEGYTAGLGRPILGGGRYDRLPGKFGEDMAATGFAIGVEPLAAVLERQGCLPAEPAIDCLVVPGPGGTVAALEQAAKLRRCGSRVEIELVVRGREASLQYARQKGIARVMFEAGGGWEEQRVSPESGECTTGESYYDALFGS